MIIGVGTDIIEVMRVERAAQKQGFINRVFTRAEQRMIEERGKSAQTLAANFAGKEAVAKALGTGFGKIAWTDVEILRQDNGQPCVTLTGKAKQVLEQHGKTNICISLSHIKAYAIAYAVIEAL